MSQPADEWGLGSYEATATELAPVSDVAIAALGLRTGETLLDVACGTGNAASVASAAGARVSGLDGSSRLLDVARRRVPDGDFVLGDAATLPFADGAFDAAVSVFGVIFASPAERAAAEMARVVRLGGRLAIASWPGRGPMFGAVSVMRQAISRLRPPEGPPPTDWGDLAVLEQLLAPYGRLEISEHALAHADVTPEEFWDRWERLHPMWIRARGVLEPAGAWEAVREASIAALREGGIGDGATSPYLLSVVVRG